MHTLIMLIALLLGSVAGVSVAEARGADAPGGLAPRDHKQEVKECKGEPEVKETPGVPELDPGSAGAAAMLLLGGSAIVAGRRRRADAPR